MYTPRRDVYFLNIFYIRGIYRFNRSRALHPLHSYNLILLFLFSFLFSLQFTFLFIFLCFLLLLNMLTWGFFILKDVGCNSNIKKNNNLFLKNTWSDVINRETWTNPFQKTFITIDMDNEVLITKNRYKHSRRCIFQHELITLDGNELKHMRGEQFPYHIV